MDQNGALIGQKPPKSKAKLGAGIATCFSIKHTQREPPESKAQAEYVMPNINGDDAICLSYVSVNSNPVDWTWYGEMGVSVRRLVCQQFILELAIKLPNVLGWISITQMVSDSTPRFFTCPIPKINQP
jgi:hypothetical protein